jgi:hypothetical protein
MVFPVQPLYGSACGPVIVPVFKTGGRQAILSPVGSTPTRFRHFFSRTRNHFRDRSDQSNVTFDGFGVNDQNHGCTLPASAEESRVTTDGQSVPVLYFTGAERNVLSAPLDVVMVREPQARLNRDESTTPP